MDSQSLTLFTGNANPALAQETAHHLMVPLGRATVGRFSDGEVNIEIMENVRGRDVFIVQSTCPTVNESLIAGCRGVRVGPSRTALHAWSRCGSTRCGCCTARL